GWSLRHPAIGGSGQTLASGGATGGTLLGSTIPFPATREDREATGDPRRSIEERYASRDSYLDQIRQAAQQLVNQDYLLPEDLDRVMHQASEHYDELRRRVRQTQAADN
ncbi:MAG TPA: alpha/beta hydrolase domain-containing protein, partial [Dehalococcoidia bacterium]|nr:alpha/beta hydrolase domain-containing protein [Dehalococcoidia bacterium]